MFGVPKYSAALEKIRQERNVEGLFNHNLISIDNKSRVATFSVGEGKMAEREFDFLHVVPPQCAPDFIRDSPLGTFSFFRVCRHPASDASKKKPHLTTTLSRVSRRCRMGRRRCRDDSIDQVLERLLARRRFVLAQLEDGRRHLFAGTRPR